MASITLDRVRKVHENGHVAVRDLTLEIVDGELMVLVGPSGSGKSTVLRLIAGLDTPTSGRILIDGQNVTGVPPQRRDLAMVFQSYALYPHLTVRDNLSFALRMRKVPPAAIGPKVEQVAATLGLDSLLERRPAQLSGGQRQRVALGRAMVREPRAFLLDEPLSNLDPALRVETRAELALLHRRLKTTMVHVTHDQEEAMTLGSRIAVLRDGALEQVGAPMDLYRRPANTFVAGFIGSPAMNLLPGTASVSGRTLRVRCGSLAISMIEADVPRESGVAASLAATGAGEEVVVGIRPHEVDLVPAAEAELTGDVTVVEPLGSTMLIHVRVDDFPARALRVLAPADLNTRVDDTVSLRVRRDRLHVFDAASGKRVCYA